MRVLFSSTPYWGHINPMLPLAHAFVEHGDELVWATPPEGCERLHRAGFAVRPAGRIGEPIPKLQARFPEIATLPPAERPDLLFAKTFGRERSEPMLGDLLAVMDDWSPSLVVSDAAEFAAPIAGALHGVPCVTHSFGALFPERRVANAGLDVAPLWTAHGLEPRPYGGRYDHLYLDIYPPSLQSQHRPHVPATQHLRTVTNEVVGHDSLPDWLKPAGSRPVVYVTFGTVFNDAATLREAVAGVQRLDVFAVVTVGPDGDVDALGHRPENVHIERYIPQAGVLPYCAAVISHAGSGTFLAALAAGLPQVCVPLGADQYLNADACSDVGAGLVASPSADEIHDALSRLLNEQPFAVAAGAVAQDIAAMPSPLQVGQLLTERYGTAGSGPRSGAPRPGGTR